MEVVEDINRACLVVEVVEKVWQEVRREVMAVMREVREVVEEVLGRSWRSSSSKTDEQWAGVTKQQPDDNCLPFWFVHPARRLILRLRPSAPTAAPADSLLTPSCTHGQPTHGRLGPWPTPSVPIRANG